MKLLYLLTLHLYSLMFLAKKQYLKQQRNFIPENFLCHLWIKKLIILAELATTNVLMLTHDRPYCQIDGLAMGSQPAPPLSNIFLSKYEPIIQDDAKLFERYMDNILRTIKQQFIQAKLKEINALHPNLKFTLEVEAAGKLFCINHVNDKLSSIWYCKHTDTGLIMNFHALAPKRYKRSVVEGFVHRVHRACSSWENFHESIEKVKMTLQRFMIQLLVTQLKNFCLPKKIRRIK